MHDVIMEVMSIILLVQHDDNVWRHLSTNTRKMNTLYAIACMICAVESSSCVDKFLMHCV